MAASNRLVDFLASLLGEVQKRLGSNSLLSNAQRDLEKPLLVIGYFSI